MDIEFHYYVTYILAKEAGFSQADSKIIAYASQYTDDNNKVLSIGMSETGIYNNCISQTMDILKPQRERLEIYPCFHFFPGDCTVASTARNDGKTHIYNTTPNSRNVNILIDEALNAGDMYWIGICTHCYADTWAHQNFVGAEDVFNSLGKITPNIGHADAGYNPDIPNLIWEDVRLISTNRMIDNKRRFIEAAKNIYHKFITHIDSKILDATKKSKWETLENKIIDAIGESSETQDRLNKNRIKRYAEIAPVAEYNENEWFDEAVERKSLFALHKKSGFENSHWYKFQEAVKRHHQAAQRIIAMQNAEKWASNV